MFVWIDLNDKCNGQIEYKVIRFVSNLKCVFQIHQIDDIMSVSRDEIVRLVADDEITFH